MKSKRVGFKRARARLCEALQHPATIVHEQRRNQAEKNLLASGVITCAEVLSVARGARGSGYSEGPHDQDASIVVHVIRHTQGGIEWYVKWYCIEPNVTFISIHH